MEDTLSPDKRIVVEEDNVEALISYFKKHYPSLSESNKAEIKKKKHVNKVRLASFNSVGMRTRAQKKVYQFKHIQEKEIKKKNKHKMQFKPSLLCFSHL